MSNEIRGTVRFSDDSPAARVTVVAYECDLRRQESLGQKRTDQDGSYLIEYSELKVMPREGGSADLLVKVYDDGGSELAASEIHFNVSRRERIDLTIPLNRREAPTLIERVASALR